MQSLKQSQLTDFFKCKRNVVDDVTKNSKSATVKASQRVSNSKRLIPVNLPLPAKYRQLLEKFRHCDAIVGRLYNRKERCSIQRLTSAVESITKLRMTKRNLAQIVFTYPHSFKVTVEKFKNNLREERENLFIYPDFTDYPDADQIVNPTFLSRRLIKLRRILLQMTIKCHEKFLQTLPVPIKIESSRVRRWHPKFDLELSTDDIRAASLPEINENVLNKPVNGQMLLEIGKTIRSQRMKRVLEKIASKRKHETLRKLSKFSSIDTSESGAIAKSISPERSPDNKKRSCIDLKVNKSTHLIDHHSVSVEDLNTVCKVTDPVLDNCVCENVLLNDFDRTKVHVNPHSSNKQSIIDARKAITESSKIKGLSEQLLLKIRQREEKNKIETLITSAPEFAEEQKISEVPKFVRTVRNYFLTEQRVAIPENKVRCKVMESLRDITSEIYDMCLETALREYSSWISRIPIRGIDYLKVRRNVDVNKLLSNLEKS